VFKFLRESICPPFPIFPDVPGFTAVPRRSLLIPQVASLTQLYGREIPYEQRQGRHGHVIGIFPGPRKPIAVCRPCSFLGRLPRKLNSLALFVMMLSNRKERQEGAKNAMMIRSQARRPSIIALEHESPWRALRLLWALCGCQQGANFRHYRAGRRPWKFLRNNMPDWRHCHAEGIFACHGE